MMIQIYNSYDKFQVLVVENGNPNWFLSKQICWQKALAATLTRKTKEKEEYNYGCYIAHEHILILY